MKLKNFLGGLFVTAVFVAASSVASFAADPVVSFKAMNPTDFSGNELDSLKAGDVFILPIDVQSTDGMMDVSQFEVNFDTNVLTLGVDAVANAEAGAYYGENDTKTILEGTTIRGGLNVVKSINPLTQKATYFGNDNLTVVTTAPGTVRIQWSGLSTTGFDVTKAQNEFVLFFTVNEGAQFTELNADVVKDLYVLSAQGNPSTDKGTSNYEGSVSKLNACYGAFNINIDSSALPYWIQGLKVAVNGGAKVDVTEYQTTDNVNFTFPVRVVTNSTNAEKATVEVFANTSSDEAGTTNAQTDVSMGTFEITLNSPTAYADNTVSAQ